MANEPDCSDLPVPICHSPAMHSSAPVIVVELPEELSHAQVKTFLPELWPLLEADRPRLVLECAHVRHIDIGGVEMLLHCLEETMKADGDLKLATVSPAFEATLQRMQVDRLFEIFDTDKEAVQSFYASQPRAGVQGEPRYTDEDGALDGSQAA